MPSAWKKAKLGGIPRLLASGLGSGATRGVGDSPLVVQAGFPTSLADLLVKNRARLKKTTPRWLRRRSRTGEADAEPGSAAVISEIVATDAVPPPNPPPRPAKPERKQEERRLPVAARARPRRDAISEGCPERSTMEVAREAEGMACEVPSRKEPEKNAPSEARNSSAVVTLAKVVFLVFVLAIGTQETAIRVSISAFTILFLESMGRGLIRSRKPHGESTKMPNTAVAGGVSVSDLLRPPGRSNSSGNRESPINNSAGSCDPEGRLDFKALVEVTALAAQWRHPALETKDGVGAEGGRGDQKAPTGSRKAKNLLRKLVPKKLQGGKCGKGRKVGGEAVPASDSSSKGASDQKGEGEETLEEEEAGGTFDCDSEDDARDAQVVGFGIPAELHACGLKDAASLVEKVGGPTRGSSGRHVFFVVILAGLVGGRFAAMALAVLWLSLAPSVGSLWKSWKRYQSY